VTAGRLFLAVPLPDRVREELADHLAAHPLPGRAVPPANWHLTLRFLGDTDAEEAERLAATLAAAAFPAAFEVRLGGFGAFPRPARARVAWLGLVAGTEPLAELAAAVEAAVRRAGLPAEHRPFSPHLTLARLRDPQDVRAALAALPPFEAVVPVHEVVLHRSHLGAGPPRYEAVRRFALG